MNMIKKWFDSLKAAIASKDTKKVEELMAASPVTDSTVIDEATGAHIHIHQGSQAASMGDRKWNDKEIEEEFGKVNKAVADCRTSMDANHKSIMDSLEELKSGKSKEEAEDKEIEGKLEEEAPAGTGDRARIAKDSAFLADAYRQTVSFAEIIAPGLHTTVFDAAVDPKKTYRNICALRRKALMVGSNDSATNGIIEAVHGRPLTTDALDAMTCGDVRTLFHSVAVIKKEKNNGTPVHAAAATHDAGGEKPIRTVADWNERNRNFWK